MGQEVKKALVQVHLKVGLPFVSNMLADIYKLALWGERKL